MVGGDANRAAIEAARKRAAAKRAALSKQGVLPRNVSNLTRAQREQIQAAESRRRQAKSTHKSEAANEE